MLSFLKDHPFAVEAFFDNTMVLTFAAPKDEIQRLIPPCLELDIFDDRWGFVAFAMVQTRALRPKGFPRFMGNDFFLIGYRIFVRYTNTAGKRLRGLYILKSETDKKRMEILGNLFTRYNYTTTDIIQSETVTGKTTRSVRSDFAIETIDPNRSPIEAKSTIKPKAPEHRIPEASDAAIPLPAGSPFNDWKEARRFAGPLPFTFTFSPKTREVLIIEGVREHWQPRPVQVKSWHLSFLASLNLSEVRLANAFAISDIPYSWEKGKIEKWNG